LGFQKQAKDEVVITDAKLEIVFASHNMTKMNGYVEEEDRKKPKNVSRSFSVLTSSKIKAIQLSSHLNKQL
jgi:hypothetical protein